MPWLLVLIGMVLSNMVLISMFVPHTEVFQPPEVTVSKTHKAWKCHMYVSSRRNTMWMVKRLFLFETCQRIVAWRLFSIINWGLLPNVVITLRRLVMTHSWLIKNISTVWIMNSFTVDVFKCPWLKSHFPTHFHQMKCIDWLYREDRYICLNCLWRIWKVSDTILFWWFW